MDGLHLLKTAERVTLADQLTDWSLVKRPSDQQDDIVDHVAIPVDREIFILY